jgi:hypothetical protein
MSEPVKAPEQEGVVNILGDLDYNLIEYLSYGNGCKNMTGCNKIGCRNCMNYIAIKKFIQALIISRIAEAVEKEKERIMHGMVNLKKAGKDIPICIIELVKS